MRSVIFKKSLFLLISLLFMLVVWFFMDQVSSSSKLSFWNVTRKGANMFSQEILRDDIHAAKEFGIEFLRIAPDKFLTKQKDFLIGDVDHYDRIVPEDMDRLKVLLDICAEEQMPVVLTMLSLPGSRWKQHNDDQDDLRIWMNEQYMSEAAAFWRDLAQAFKGHPALVGYNILNEPHPEKLYSESLKKLSSDQKKHVYQMFNQFNHEMVKAIRSVDQDMPIIIDSSMHADAATFDDLEPQADPNILYSFHMYEPFDYTNYKSNKGKWTYPGDVNGISWNKEKLVDHLAAVRDFQSRHQIPSNRILVGEFGGHRMSKGLSVYFADLIDIFEENQWHFAFYAFREDTWDGMNYELGIKKLPASYWVSFEKGEAPGTIRDAKSKSFEVIKKSLKKAE